MTEPTPITSKTAKAPKAEKPAPEPVALSGQTKTCTGAPKYGIPAHENVPVENFAKIAGNPDGLSRICKDDIKAYSAALKAAKEAGTFTLARGPKKEKAAKAPRRTKKDSELPALPAEGKPARGAGRNIVANQNGRRRELPAAPAETAAEAPVEA